VEDEGAGAEGSVEFWAGGSEGVEGDGVFLEGEGDVDLDGGWGWCCGHGG